MLFNSFQFVVFLVPVLLGYWLLPSRSKTYFLLAASYVFYGSWDYRFLSLIVLSTMIDYGAGLAIDATEDPRRRKLYLLVSMTANLGILGFFKYCNFFVENLEVLLRSLGVSFDFGTLHIVLPVGISFYTFQSMSYTIDVYRRQTKATPDFIGFATYVAFFPQLVAGPIERFDRLYGQLENPVPPTVEYLRRALFLCLQGYVKKVVIADNISAVIDPVFDNPARFMSGALLEASVLFTCQIYCDFSGYSDIARGVSYLFGVELMENFRAPLFSRSITEFWRRWHISLSTWLRDYLYIPLGGNRKGPRATYVNLMLTMLLGGLWHGAQWKFVVWGALHGLALAFERRFVFRGRSRDIPLPTRRNWPLHLCLQLVTFAAVVFIFIFFRADDLTGAYVIIRRIAALVDIRAVATLRLAYALGAIVILDLPLFLTDCQTWALRWPLVLRVILYSLLLLSLVVLSGHHNQSFIYFAF
jgi:alginate O-acetyltransferase complex protein AlgI